MDLGAWLGTSALIISAATLISGVLSLKNKQRDFRIKELSDELAEIRRQLVDCEESNRYTKQELERIRNENIALMRRLMNLSNGHTPQT